MVLGSVFVAEEDSSDEEDDRESLFGQNKEEA